MPAGIYQVDVVVVGGGGGGSGGLSSSSVPSAAAAGNGGGGGQVVVQSDMAVAGTVPVIIGTGGGFGANGSVTIPTTFPTDFFSTAGSSGGSSGFGSLTALGGAGGGAARLTLDQVSSNRSYTSCTSSAGNSGGNVNSGGLVARTNSDPTDPNDPKNWICPGAGGGGAGVAGSNGGPNNDGGKGGDGLTVSAGLFNGSSDIFGGGGGGGQFDSSGGKAGAGGTGGGAPRSGASTGEANTGGAGAGGRVDSSFNSAMAGSSGGSGVVIIRFLATQTPPAPLPARTPLFDAPVSTADGFTVNVTNYDPAFAWTESVSAGSLSSGTITGSTLPLTVTGLAAGASATITVNTTQGGYDPGSATVTGQATSNPGPNPPTPSGPSSPIAVTTTSVEPQVTVTYAPNRGLCDKTSERVTKGKSVVLPGVADCDRPGFVLSEWNTQVNGAGMSHEPGSTFIADANARLFAMWRIDDPEPFTCTSDLYQVSGTGGGVLYAYDPLMNTMELVPASGGPSRAGGVNATGYNLKDNFIYGISPRGQNRHLWKMGSNGVYIDLGAIVDSSTGKPLEGGAYIAGDFVRDDILLATSNPRTITTIDVAPTRRGDAAVATVRTTSSGVWNAADIAFNADRTAGYGMAGRSLFIVSLPGANAGGQLNSTGRADSYSKKTVQGVPASGAYGASFVDQQGNAYFWNNDQRQMYLITPDELKKNHPTARVLGTDPATVLGSSASLTTPTDGASCPTAPVVIVSLRYDINRGTGTAPVEQSGFADQTVSVESNADFERSGFEFKGWNTAADGSGDAYTPGDIYSLGSNDTVLYAQWGPVIPAPVVPAANVLTTPVPVAAQDNGQIQFSPIQTLTQDPRFIDTTCSITTTALVNGSFEQPAIPAKSSRMPNQRDVPGWQTTATDGKIEIWSTGFQNVAAPEGKQFAELNATQASELFQVVTTNPGDTLTWSLMHRARAAGAVGDTMTVNIGAEDSPPNATYTFTTTLPQGWVRQTGTYVVPDGQTRTRFGFESGPTASGRASIGNFLDDIFFTTTECLPAGQPQANVIEPVTDPSGPQQPAAPTTPTPSPAPTSTSSSDAPQELDTSSIRLVDPKTNTLALTAQTDAGNWQVNTRVGTVTLTPNPVYSGNATIPVVIETTTGEPFRVVLSAPVKRCDTGPSLNATVYFAPLSAKLTGPDKRTLRQLVRKASARGSISCAVVRGFVQPVGGTANDKSLSKDRARAVAKYLQELGVGRIADVEGLGRADEKGAKARRATARVFVQVSRT